MRKAFIGVEFYINEEDPNTFKIYNNGGSERGAVPRNKSKMAFWSSQWTKNLFLGVLSTVVLAG